MKCLDCNFDEGTLLKEFDNESNYSWYELSEMTEVCASCGSENIKIEKGDKWYYLVKLLLIIRNGNKT